MGQKNGGGGGGGGGLKFQLLSIKQRNYFPFG